MSNCTKTWADTASGAPLQSVTLTYPDFRVPAEDQPRLQLMLEHVRSACELYVRFDGDRNGWVLEVEELDEKDGVKVCSGRYREVAFVDANEE